MLCSLPMTLGYCPFCRRTLAPSAETCPGCGNTQFVYATGNTRLHSSGKVQCQICAGTGVVVTPQYEKCKTCDGGKKEFRTLIRQYWKRCPACDSNYANCRRLEDKRETCKYCAGIGHTTWERKEFELADTRTCTHRWIEAKVPPAVPSINDVDPTWRTQFSK